MNRNRTDTVEEQSFRCSFIEAQTLDFLMYIDFLYSLERGCPLPNRHNLVYTVTITTACRIHQVRREITSMLLEHLIHSVGTGQSYASVGTVEYWHFQESAYSAGPITSKHADSFG